MDLDVLRALIDSDPDNAGRSDVEVAAWCNAAVGVNRPIGSRALLRWGAADARLAALEGAAAANDSASVRSIARAAVLTVSRGDTEIDVDDPAHMALVDALVAASVLSADDKLALLAEAVVEVTRAAAAGLPAKVKVGWVQEVRRGE